MARPTVLCATSLRDATTAARAAELARQLDAVLELVHVAPTPELGPLAEASEARASVRDELDRELARRRRHLEDLAGSLEGGVERRSLLLEGRPAAAVEAAARALGATALVVGVGRRRPEGSDVAAVGPHTARLLRSVDCPVLVSVARPRPDARTWVVGVGAGCDARALLEAGRAMAGADGRVIALSGLGLPASMHGAGVARLARGPQRWLDGRAEGDVELATVADAALPALVHAAGRSDVAGLVLGRGAAGIGSTGLAVLQRTPIDIYFTARDAR